ncbi:MAG: efflux RND transporter permease subunit [Chloroflexi bacterium]|nr:efflux RND transporter permease subunit [Chloroflexota bacterium]
MWLSDTSIKQPVLVTMALTALLIFGGISYSRMGVDLFPDVSFPLAVVSTTLPGASPEEVETLVSKPVEDALASLNNLRSLRSISTESLSQVFVEFEIGQSMDSATNAIRDQLNTVKPKLPEDASDPVLLRFDPTAQPILIYAVSDRRDEVSALQLRRQIEDIIKPRLEKLEGVGQVEVLGGLQRQIQVALSLDALRARNLSVQEVVAALRTQNVSLPGGRITTGGQDLLIKTTGEFQRVEDLPHLVVANRSGAPVYLRDIASISDTSKERRQYNRLNQKDTVVLTVQKQSGSNTVRAAELVAKELSRLEQEFPSLKVAIVRDDSRFIKDSNQDVTTALILGAVFASLIVLLFFRDIRNTLVTVAGLPVIVMGTFWVISWFGYTINLMTLMALSLCIGILIDDAIVVRENIFRHMERGEDPKVAASRGTAQIAFAVLATTFSIIAVFLPVAFTGGVIGQFFRQFGITVAVAVLISLIEAFTLAPMLSALFFQRIEPAEPGRGRPAGRLVRLFTQVQERYGLLLGWSLGHRRRVIFGAMGVFVASLAMVPFIGSQFMPQDDTGTFGIGIELPAGATLDDTDFTVRHVESILLREPEVDNVYAAVGTAGGPLGGGNAERANLVVNLKQRGRTERFMEKLRGQLEGTPGLSFGNNNFQSGASTAITARRILLSVTGSASKEELERASSELMARMSRMPGVVDLESSYKPGKPELRMAIDRARAVDLGVSAASAASTVRLLINGEAVSTLREGDKETDIFVRLREEDRNRLNYAFSLTVPSAKGGQAPLSAFTQVQSAIGPTQIDRENRQQRILVGANPKGRAESEINADIRAAVNEMGLPPNVSVHFTGLSQQNAESFQALTLSLLLSIVFVYMVLASQFGSFIHPFTIMLSLPLSFAGAFLPLLISRKPLDVMAMIGIIMLMGLVTKNAILLVDFILRARREGVPREEAVRQAGPMRLRPILMTTLAMIAGLTPTALSLGAGSAWRAPMALTVIGGLITSTLLTLLVVPVFYTFLDDAQRLFRRRSRVAQEAELVASLASEPVPTRQASD